MATAIALVPSAIYTGPGIGDAVDVTNTGTARLTLAVTVNSDRPTAPPPPELPIDAPSTFTVRIETSIDGTTNWRQVLCVSEQDARGAMRFTVGSLLRSERRVFVGLDRFIRARWDLSGGRGKLTFGISGEVV